MNYLSKPLLTFPANIVKIRSRLIVPFKAPGVWWAQLQNDFWDVFTDSTSTHKCEQWNWWQT